MRTDHQKNPALDAGTADPLADVYVSFPRNEASPEEKLLTTTAAPQNVRLTASSLGYFYGGIGGAALLLAPNLEAATVKIAWDPSPSATAQGYNEVVLGYSPGQWRHRKTEDGLATTSTLVVEGGEDYYISVRYGNSSGISGFSNIIKWTAPADTGSFTVNVLPFQGTPPQTPGTTPPQPPNSNPPTETETPPIVVAPPTTPPWDPAWGEPPQVVLPPTYNPDAPTNPTNPGTTTPTPTTPTEPGATIPNPTLPPVTELPPVVIVQDGSQPASQTGTNQTTTIEIPESSSTTTNSVVTTPVVPTPSNGQPPVIDLSDLEENGGTNSVPNVTPTPTTPATPSETPIVTQQFRLSISSPSAMDDLFVLTIKGQPAVPFTVESTLGPGLNWSNRWQGVLDSEGTATFADQRYTKFELFRVRSGH